MQNGHDVNTRPVLARLRHFLGRGWVVGCLICAGCSSTPPPVEITDSVPQDGDRPAPNDPNQILTTRSSRPDRTAGSSNRGESLWEDRAAGIRPF
ncbi:MAG: hypothetical protein U1F77_15375, partial [Kiritimatiellia bacterium]